jgi:hypothetical protein
MGRFHPHGVASSWHIAASVTVVAVQDRAASDLHSLNSWPDNGNLGKERVVCCGPSNLHAAE